MKTYFTVSICGMLAASLCLAAWVYLSDPLAVKTPFELFVTLAVTMATVLGVIGWLCLFHYLIGIDPRENADEL